MRRPPPLAPGARVALVAPSGPVRDESEIERSIKNVARFGWTAVVADHARDRTAYLAGADADRLADLNHAASDPSIDAVWCIRGGYGAMRLLDGINYDAWKRSSKPLIGYSDITALHCAIGARASLVTFHGPTARSTIPELTERSFRCALIERSDSAGVAPHGRTLVGGRARGRLAGGNLSLLSALAGTPYFPDFTGAIVVIEDVNESVYRIDRMLTQLRLGGLARCAGLVFGGFTDVPPEPTDAERSAPDVLAEIARAVGVPCIAGAPFGHVDEQWTLPIGAMVELDADALRLTVG